MWLRGVSRNEAVVDARRRSHPSTSTLTLIPPVGRQHFKQLPSTDRLSVEPVVVEKHVVQVALGAEVESRQIRRNNNIGVCPTTEVSA